MIEGFRDWLRRYRPVAVMLVWAQAECLAYLGLILLVLVVLDRLYPTPCTVWARSCQDSVVWVPRMAVASLAALPLVLGAERVVRWLIRNRRAS